MSSSPWPSTISKRCHRLEPCHILGEPYREVYGDDVELPPDLTARITCNGKTIAVTWNLLDALVAIKRIGVQEPLWVDPLCINQDDLRERASQISLMGQIYSSVNQVIIWLGPYIQDSGFDDLVWATAEFLPLIHLHWKKIREHMSSGRQYDSEFWKSLSLDDPLPSLVRAAYFCRSCRWFSRA